MTAVRAKRGGSKRRPRARPTSAGPRRLQLGASALVGALGGGRKAGAVRPSARAARPRPSTAGPAATSWDAVEGAALARLSFVARPATAGGGLSPRRDGGGGLARSSSRASRPARALAPHSRLPMHLSRAPRGCRRA